MRACVCDRADSKESLQPIRLATKQLTLCADMEAGRGLHVHANP